MKCKIGIYPLEIIPIHSFYKKNIYSILILISCLSRFENWLAMVAFDIWIFPGKKMEEFLDKWVIVSE